MVRHALAASVFLTLGAFAAYAAPLPMILAPIGAKDVKLAKRRPLAKKEQLRDAVADPKAMGRAYVSQALGRLAAGDPAGAIELAARALSLDPTDESAYATMKLGESQLPGYSVAYRDALMNRSAPHPGHPAAHVSAVAVAPGEIPPPGSVRGFWRLVFSPVIAILLLLAGVAHVTLGRLRRTLTVRISRRDASTTRSAAPLAVQPAVPEGYRFLSVLGEGGMGVVYQAEDVKLGRKVAIKRMREELKRDQKERDHFLQEARMVAGLHHPTIVDIHTIVEEGDDLFLVFEYVEGKTVERLLAEKKALPLDFSKRVMRGVCEALEYAHKHGVVHRDLKPSNIMVTPEGETKVMDFGVARRAKDSMMRFTLTETVAGTPIYMAPEAEDGIVRKESDVYALGACLYEMATGEHPFPQPTSRAAKVCMRYIPPSRQRPDLPPTLDQLVDAALQPDPDRRIPTAREFMRRFENVI